MKHFGSTLDFTLHRNDDIIRTYRRILAKSNFIIMPDIFQKVAESPASRFWVSEERAAIVISRMIAGKTLPPMRPNKQEMFLEIYRRVIILRRHNPNESLFQLVSTVVNQPAPKFYLTPRTVGEFIYRIKKGWYDTPKQSQRHSQ